MTSSTVSVAPRRSPTPGTCAAPSAARRLRPTRNASTARSLAGKFAAQGFPVGDAGPHLRILEERSKACDQPGSAPECQIGPEPLCRYKDRRPHSDQEVD